jgi:hypothetical protein
VVAHFPYDAPLLGAVAMALDAAEPPTTGSPATGTPATSLPATGTTSEGTMPEHTVNTGTLS